MSTRYSANIVRGISPTANSATASGVWSIEDASQRTGDVSWPLSSSGNDPTFKDVTLLLPGDGTNGGQNNTFVDGSTNSASITRFGNATQGSFSPYRAGWSNHFDGTGDYLTVANNAALSFGTGDFTIELWVNFSALSTNRVLLDRWASGNANSWQLYWRATGTSIAFLVGASTVLLQDPSTTNIVANTWNHIAVTRSGTTNRLFINGVVVSTATNSTSLTSSLTLGVGTQVSTLTNYFEGYISNLRIVNGTALYTDNFTPSTTPLQPVTNTVLLTCNSYRFADSSANNFAVTRNGDTRVQPLSPFGSMALTEQEYSAAFSGTANSILSVASNAALAVGTGDFTLELWYYTTVAPTSTNVCLFAAGSGNLFLQVRNTAFGIGSVGSAEHTAFTTTFAAGQWYHIAVSRVSGTVRGFVNGTFISSATNTNNYGQSGVVIGGLNSSSQLLTGYISNLRLVVGTGLYNSSSNFTPATTTLTAVSGTALLACHSDRFVDGSTNAFAVTTTGDAAARTFSPFTPTYTPLPYSTTTLGGSAYFDGTDDYLTLPDSDVFFFDTGDFTLEAWVYLTSKNAFNVFQQSNGTSGSVLKWSFYFNNANNQLRLEGHNPAATPLVWVQASWTPITGRWYHIACTRQSNAHRLFVDGVQLVNTTTATALPQCASELWIGKFKDAPAATPNQLTGYMASGRIIKGTARYTSSFVPPIAPQTAVTNTSLLLDFTAGQIIDVTGNANLETVSSAQISTGVRRIGTGSISFNGTTDWLIIPASPTQALGTSPFTIEAWVYMTATAGTKPIYDSRGSGASATGFSFFVNSSSQLCVFTNNAATGTSSTTLSTNTWTHVALVRTGTGTNQTTYYIDGVARGTITLSGNFTDPITSVSRVGASVAGEPWPGYIDDLRVSRIARYTGTFTPPELLSTY